MPATLTLARNGVRRGLRNRSVLLLGIVGPLALGFVLALAFGGSGPTIKVALVDLDGSDLSAGIASGLSDGLAGSPIEMELIDAPEDGDLSGLEKMVEDGAQGAVMVIPPGYGDSVVGVPESLVVLAAGDNAIAGSVAEGLADSVAGTTDLQRAVAIALDRAGLDPGAALGGDPVEPVVSVREAEFSESFDAPTYFGPFAVFLFLGLGVTARSLLRDESDGILDRVRASPVSMREVVGGAATTVMVQGALAAVAVVGVSTLAFGAYWGDPVNVVVVVSVFIVSVAGMLGIVVGVASSELQAESWTNVLAFSFAIIGGSFFGGALLPGVLGVIGTMTPNGAAMRALIELGPGGQSLGDVWYLLAWMLVIGIGGMLLGGRLLRRRLR
ncbi:MAG: ABC transporter permease [Actinomycetia bacterium]|nr:ABC transporter permease [Actinomycetes bacterium]